MYPIEVPRIFHRTAELWHDGQDSALYSVLSTGYIHDSEYRAMLESELRRLLSIPRKSPMFRANAFLRWLESLPEDVDADDESNV